MFWLMILGWVLAAPTIIASLFVAAILWIWKFPAKAPFRASDLADCDED